MIQSRENAEEARNPYAELAELMAGDQQRVRSGICLGKVLTAKEGHLVIFADGQELDQNDLMLNAMLAWDYHEDIKATYHEKGGEVTLGVFRDVKCHISVSGADVEVMRLYGLPGYLDGSVELRLTAQRLKEGDQVLLLPAEDEQIYYVLCKVVKAGEYIAAPAGRA